MQKTEQPFELAFEQNPLPMWVVDRETMRMLEVNDAALRQYGYSHDEFCSLSLASIRPPDDLPRFQAHWRRLVEDSTPGKSSPPSSLAPATHSQLPPRQAPCRPQS